eukprot:COSAG02_NODE_13133_length_1441_cov_2.350224_1_plen_42_part_01
MSMRLNHEWPRFSLLNVLNVLNVGGIWHFGVGADGVGISKLP